MRKVFGKLAISSRRQLETALGTTSKPMATPQPEGSPLLR
jgi:hypothetical protein